MSGRPAPSRKIEKPWVPTLLVAPPPPPTDDATLFSSGYTGHEAAYRASDGTAACECGAKAATPLLLRQEDCRYDS